MSWGCFTWCGCPRFLPSLATCSLNLCNRIFRKQLKYIMRVCLFCNTYATNPFRKTPPVAHVLPVSQASSEGVTASLNDFEPLLALGLNVCWSILLIRPTSLRKRLFSAWDSRNTGFRDVGAIYVVVWHVRPCLLYSVCSWTAPDPPRLCPITWSSPGLSSKSFPDTSERSVRLVCLPIVLASSRRSPDDVVPDIWRASPYIAMENVRLLYSITPQCGGRALMTAFVSASLISPRHSAIVINEAALVFKVRHDIAIYACTSPMNSSDLHCDHSKLWNEL